MSLVPSTQAPSARQALPALGVAVVLLIAAAIRLGPWGSVFTETGVRIVGDDDGVYHVLRAERLARGDPNGQWFDRNMNHPRGAAILWPPGWDALLAGGAWAFAGGEPERADVERVAAFAPVLAGLAGVALVIAIGWRSIGLAGALFAGLLVALLPGGLNTSVLGRPDHHGAELALFLLAVWAFLRSEPSPRRSDVVLFGVALALGPWTWQGSTLHLAFLVAVCGFAFLVRGLTSAAARGSLRLMRDAGALAAILVLLSLFAWGPPGFLTPASLNGISILHPAAMFAIAAWCAIVLRIPERVAAGWPTRLAAGAVVALPLLLALFFTLRGPLAHALVYLGKPSAWLAGVAEIRPALFGARSTFAADLQDLLVVGPILLAPLVGGRALLRRGRSSETGFRDASLIGLGCIFFGALFLRSFRFYLYLTPFLALAAGAWLQDAIRAAASATRLRGVRLTGVVAAALLCLLPGIPAALAGASQPPATSDGLLGGLATLRRLGAETSGSVLAPWPLGHSVQYHARLPVLLTPFGSDIGEDGLRDAAAFTFAASEEEAEARLRARDVRFLLVMGNQNQLADLYPYAPPGSTPLVAVTHDYWGEGRLVETVEAYGVSIPGWLYEFDGLPLLRGRTRGLPFLRLVHESPDPERLKFFERVEGARVVVHAEPASVVELHVDVVTNQGRRFHWWTSEQTDAAGMVALRTPYATGANGDVQAGVHAVRVGAEIVRVPVPESFVRAGAPIEVDASARASAGSPRQN